jgi:Fe-S-cluster containining protein
VTAWYRDGLRFACKRCGNCCSGKGSVVVVSPREREALARQTGMSVAEFEERHCRIAWYCPEPGRPVSEATPDDDVVLIDDDETGDCEWLVRNADGTTACRVNAAKPDQCASYPFWPRIVGSREAWEDEGARCKGIGQGEPVPAAEVERRAGLEAAMEDLELLLAELDYEVKDLGARCWLSGDCCDFDAAGHRLFTSEIEARRFAKGVDLTGWDSASRLCPAWKDRRCTAREHRPMACRTYFCDPRFETRVNELTERYVTRLKWLHEKHGLAWDYRDHLAHLERIAASVPNVARAANDRCPSPGRLDGGLTAS